MTEYGIWRDGEMCPCVYNNIQAAEEHAYLLIHLLGYKKAQVMELTRFDHYISWDGDSPPADAGKDKEQG